MANKMGEYEIVNVKKLPWWRTWTKKFEVTLKDEKGRLHKVQVYDWATEGFMLHDITDELKKKLGLAEPKPTWTKQLLKKKIQL